MLLRVHLKKASKCREHKIGATNAALLYLFNYCCHREIDWMAELSERPSSFFSMSFFALTDRMFKDMALIMHSNATP